MKCDNSEEQAAHEEKYGEVTKRRRSRTRGGQAQQWAAREEGTARLHSGAHQRTARARCRTRTRAMAAPPVVGDQVLPGDVILTLSPDSRITYIFYLIFC